LLGLVSLATVTGLYFWLDVPQVAAAFTYLVVLVLLSLVSSLSSLIVLSFIGVGCLCYFFDPPIYSFRVDYPQDIITIYGRCCGDVRGHRGGYIGANSLTVPT